MDEAAAVAEIKIRLGGDAADISVTDASLGEIIKMSLREYIKHQPKRVLQTFSVPSDGILLPEGTLGVIRVMKASLSGSLGADVDDIDIFNVVSRPLNSLSGAGSLPEYFAMIQNHKSIESFIDCEDFLYDPGTRKLFVTPSFGSRVTVERIERFGSIEDLDDADLSWVLDYAEALTLIAEGRLRRKFTNDFLQMDGSEMVSEGAERRDALEERLEHRALLDFGMYG